MDISKQKKKNVQKKRETILQIFVFPKMMVSPQIIHFNRVFHYKPSILGYPYFWKHPYISMLVSVFLLAGAQTSQPS